MYETKTRVARESMNHTKWQENKMEKNANNKKKRDVDHDGSSGQNKGRKVIRTHIVGPSNKKVYVRKLPHCNKWHYHSECPKLKNQKRRNQAGSSEARGRVCALGGGEVDQNPNNIVDNVNS
ncbi:hypothetical protein Tco_0373156 [Tanacetum coccineum]